MGCDSLGVEWQHGELGRRSANEAVEQEIFRLLRCQWLLESRSWSPAAERQPARSRASRPPPGGSVRTARTAPPADEERLLPARLESRARSGTPPASAAARAGAGGRRCARAPRSGRATGPPLRSAGCRRGPRAALGAAAAGRPRGARRAPPACTRQSARAARDARRRLAIGPSGLGCLRDDEVLAPRPQVEPVLLPATARVGRRLELADQPHLLERRLELGAEHAPLDPRRARAARPRPRVAGDRSGSTSADGRAGRGLARRRAPGRGGRERGRRPAGSALRARARRLS